MIKQLKRSQISLNINTKLLTKIDLYCKINSFVRNKYLERLITERFNKEL